MAERSYEDDGRDRDWYQRGSERRWMDRERRRRDDRGDDERYGGESYLEERQRANRMGGGYDPYEDRYRGGRDREWGYPQDRSWHMRGEYGRDREWGYPDDRSWHMREGSPPERRTMGRRGEAYGTRRGWPARQEWDEGLGERGTPRSRDYRYDADYHQRGFRESDRPMEGYGERTGWRHAGYGEPGQAAWTRGYGGAGGMQGDLADVGPFVGRGPRGYERSPERIREDVCERLTRHGEVDASEIDVKIEDREVTLEGTVEDRRQKRMAEHIVEDVAGVRDVHNHLRLRGRQARRESTQAQGKAENREEKATRGRGGRGSETAGTP